MPRLAPRNVWAPASWARLPPFAPLAPLLRGLADHPDWPGVATYDALLEKALAAASQPPLRCEVQAPRPRRRRSPPRLRAELYDARIVEGARLPTRLGNGHDLFNVLIWAVFPRSKWALHRRQHAALVSRFPERLEGLPGARTPEQDALTGFDEGGIALLVERGLAGMVRDGLAAGDGAPLQGALEAGQSRPLLFGHAIFDHLASTEAPVWGAPEVLPVDRVPSDLSGCAALADSLLGARLADPRLFTRPNRPALKVDGQLFTNGPGAKFHT